MKHTHWNHSSSLRDVIEQLLLSMRVPTLYEAYARPGSNSGALHVDVEALRWIVRAQARAACQGQHHEHIDET